MAEVWILLVLIRGVAAANDVSPKPQLYRLVFVISAIGIATIAFGGTTIASQFPVMNSPRLLHFYRCAQWNFFCILWVVLEGVIMVYVFRVYAMIKSSLHMNIRRPSSADRLSMLARIAVTALVLCFSLLFILYQYEALGLIQQAHLKHYQINRISFFFMKICGLFWVVFDGGVAVLGYKTFKILYKNRCEQYHGTDAAVG